MSRGRRSHTQATRPLSSALPRSWREHRQVDATSSIDGTARSGRRSRPGIEVLTTRCFVAVSPTPGYEWEDGALEALLKGTLPGFSVVRRLVETKPARIQTSARIAPQRATRAQVFVAAHDTTVGDVLTAGLGAIVEK